MRGNSGYASQARQRCRRNVLRGSPMGAACGSSGGVADSATALQNRPGRTQALAVADEAKARHEPDLRIRHLPLASLVLELLDGLHDPDHPTPCARLAARELAA